MPRHYITIDGNKDATYKDEELTLSYQSSDIPKRLLDMQALYTYRPDDDYHSKRVSFYNQTAFMLDYEDDMPYTGNFTNAFPTYHDLSLAQLRGYFTWRTMILSKHYQTTSIGFIKIYLYERMNLVDKLGLQQVLSDMQFIYNNLDDAELKEKISKWMRALVVCYDVNHDYTKQYFSNDLDLDQAYQTLVSENEDYTKLYQSFIKAGFLTENNFPCKQCTKEFYAWCVGYCWHQFRNQLGNTAITKYLELNYQAIRFPLFQDAIVLCDLIPTHEYELNDHHVYLIQDGKLTCKKYWRLKGKREYIQKFFRQLDTYICAYFGVKLRKKKIDVLEEVEILPSIFQECIRAYRKTQTNVSFDIQQYSSIRHDADIVRDLLLTEEEKEEPVQVSINRTSRLSDKAYDYLMACKNHTIKQNYKAAQLSMIIDEINEYAMDVYGDILLEDDGTVIEEYEENIDMLLEGGE